jgi:hypothetical protein
MPKRGVTALLRTLLVAGFAFVRLRVPLRGVTAVLLVLLVAGFAFVRWRSSSRTLAAAWPPLSAPQKPERPARAAPLAANTPRPTARPDLALAAARENRARARYPHSSQPLQADQPDPLLRDREPSHATFSGPNGEDPTLVVFPEQVSFERADPVVLYAYLTDRDTRVAAQRIDGEVVDARGRTVAQLEYNDQALNADRAAGDLVYTARMPTGDGDGPAGGAYLVRVRAVDADGDLRAGSTGFLYSRPDAQLTGRYSDAITGGNLEVQAEVDVQRAGRFHLEATLYTRDGTPLAWAQNALNLSTGLQRIPLSFFGLIIRERDVDGPYVLRYVALSTTTSMPNAKNRLVENAYETAPYHAAEFSDQPFDDPALISDAERLERAAPRIHHAPDAAAKP